MILYLSYVKITFNICFLVSVIMARKDEYSITTYTIVLGIMLGLGSSIYSIQARRYTYGSP